MALQPIIILDEKRISSLDELRESKAIDKIYAYAKHGRLAEWLSFGGNEILAQEIASIDSSLTQKYYIQDLCAILEIPCQAYRMTAENSSEDYENELKPLLRRILLNMLVAKIFCMKNSEDKA